VNEENYLRVERSYGSFSHSFQLANSVNSHAVKADYRNGVLTLGIPKREEAKPKQIKVNVGGTLERFKFRTCSAAFPSYSCTAVYMNPEQEIELVLRVLCTRPTDEGIIHPEHEDVNPRKV